MKKPSTNLTTRATSAKLLHAQVGRILGKEGEEKRRAARCYQEQYVTNFVRTRKIMKRQIPKNLQLNTKLINK